jgi:hypothetical protein
MSIHLDEGGGMRSRQPGMPEPRQGWRVEVWGKGVYPGFFILQLLLIQTKNKSLQGGKEGK